MARLSIRRSRPVTLIALALWCTLIAATLLAMQIFGRRHALKELRASANHTLQLVTETIKGDLARFRSCLSFSPQTLSSSTR
jgi:C4-dicarboxylate-specific signal transduction histidine kinase